MINKILLLLILSGSLGAFAENSHVGFYPLGHIGIPKAVKEAAKSVFQILVPSFEGPSLNTYKIPSSEYSLLKNRFSKYKNMNPLAKKAIAAQLQFCDQQNGRTCQIFLNLESATAFLMNGRFWTAAHAVEPYLSGRADISGKNLLIFIFNQKGQLVLNPLIDAVDLQSLPAMTEKAAQRGLLYSEESDFISLHLKKNLGPSLSSSVSNLDPRTSAAQDLYIPGFAACTNCQSENSLEKLDALDRAPFPNSTGEGLRITHGPLLDLPSASEAMNLSLENLLSLAGESLIFIDADSRHGMSGAPILNAQGQVVGIFAGGKINLQQGHLRRVSRGLRVQQLL